MCVECTVHCQNSEPVIGRSMIIIIVFLLYSGSTEGILFIYLLTSATPCFLVSGLQGLIIFELILGGIFIQVFFFSFFFTPKPAFTKLCVCKLILAFQFLDFQCLPVSIFLSYWSHNPFTGVFLAQGPCCIPGPYSAALHHLSDMNVSLCRNNYLLLTVIILSL